ncbi:MAG: precorrin-6A/cobalt-precorrin-6A reductase [Gammaproteobacteria bacterium]|nr:precorrin-6A/cobalt-precorrin-6A reductase [Gammaproteobacteria bacterium]
MCLLILGGTADGRQLAEFFHQQGLPVIYSVAGLVRTPQLHCQIVSGGFTQFGGLTSFIQQHNVAAILDVTHPYAQTMSAKSVEAANNCGIPCWRFHRDAWQQQVGDHWQSFAQWSDLAKQLSQYQRVLLTCGQLSQAQLGLLQHYRHQQQWLRTAVAPNIELPTTVHWIKAIGPFALDNERQLLKKHAIDVLVSKNSGGDATSAKLQAARELAIPVMMLDRPILPDPDQIFYTHQQCQVTVLEKFSHVR